MFTNLFYCLYNSCNDWTFISSSLAIFKPVIAIFAAEIVVKYGTFLLNAVLLIDKLSAIDFTPLVVFIIRWILLLSIKSTICGSPSFTLLTMTELIQNLFKKSAVPLVVNILNFNLCNNWQINKIFSLSSSLTDMKTEPLKGNIFSYQ